MALAGCSGSSSPDDDLASDTTSLSDQSTDGDGAELPDVDALDRLTYAEDRPVLGSEGPPEVEQPELASPDERLDTLHGAELTTAIEQAVASPDIDILDVAGIVDDGPTAEEVASFGDGNTRGPTGELIILDEPASLACADVEIALTDIDDGRTTEAGAHVRSAAERSAASSVSGISAWADALAGSGGGDDGGGDDGGAQIDAVTLVGFLSVCVDGGYVL